MKKFICKYDRECNDYEILSGCNIFYLKGKRFPIKKKINLLFEIIYLALIFLNIVFLRTKYNLSRLLYYFENNIFKLGMISGKELFTFVFQIIIKVVTQIIILFYIL